MIRDGVRGPGLLTALLLVAFALKLSVVLAAVNRGIELGDEGFFLMNLKYPQAAPPPLEGYRVLGRLCGGSCDVGIVGARLYRIAAELVGSAALIAGVFAWARRRVFAPGAVGPAGFAAWCLLGTLLSVESRSLGYNDLTNLLCYSAVGASFGAAALPAGAAARRGLLAAAAGALLGLQLPVKWPTAVLVAGLVALALAFALRSVPRRERLVAGGCAAAGMAAAAAFVVVALGGLEAVTTRFGVSMELVALTEHDPLELLRLYVILDKFAWIDLAAFVAVFAGACRLARRNGAAGRDRALVVGLAAASAVLLAGVLALRMTFLHWTALYLGALLLGLSLVLLVLAARAARATREAAGAAADTGRLPLLLLLFVLPVAVIAGTNVTITMRLPTHGLPLFVLLGVLVLDVGSRADAWRFRSAVAALLVVVTSGVFVRHHVLHPYGVPHSILEQRFEVWNLPGVRVDADTRDFLTTLARQMTDLGFRPGDPVIALDYMPGLVYYLGGISPRYNFYMFRSPAFNCYNLNRAQSARPPFLILAKPPSLAQIGCLKTIRFPYDFRMPRTIPFPYERVYEGFGARGFSKLSIYAPRDASERQGR